MRCDTCKHWKQSDEWEANNAGFRKCAAIRTRWDIEDDIPDNIEKYPDDEPTVEIDYDEVGVRWHEAHKRILAVEKAYVQDGSQYRAELYTGPDFFCARYTGK